MQSRRCLRYSLTFVSTYLSKVQKMNIVITADCVLNIIGRVQVETALLHWQILATLQVELRDY